MDSRSFRFAPLAAVLCVVGLMASPVAAQTTHRPATLADEAGAGLRLPPLHASVLDIGARPAFLEVDGHQGYFGRQSRPRLSSPSRSAMKWGIAIGVIAGAVAAGAAAARYGENEGGGFCGPCFIRWSAISIPVGAGVGAAIGFAIDEARQ